MKKNATLITAGIPIITTVFAGAILASGIVSADDSVVDKVNITVPVSCSISGTGMNTHNASIVNGTYQSDIGTTNFTVFCNDNSGYSLYAIGYSNEEYGNTKMLATINNELSPTNDINTGTNTSGANSSWSMKLIPVTTASSGTEQPYTPTIESDTNGSYSNYHIVPEEYTKVATFTSNTDFTIGSSLQSTYQVYIDNTKPAGTYAGKVKYTLVHPNDAHAPVAFPATLDTGQTVNAKLKSLAATVVNGEETTITPDFDPDEGDDWDNTYDEYIKSINVHLKTAAPTGFTPTTANTISSTASIKPIYLVFDNTNDAGIMHFYTEGERIVLSADSSFMFYMLGSLSEISGISDWDTSDVVYMNHMFFVAGEDASIFSLDLSFWDTSSVTDMSYLFYEAGNSATTWSIGDLSSWDTSSVTNMDSMFSSAGNSATTWSIGDLSSWNTSSVTNMSYVFSHAGASATTWSIGDLSSWDTSNVTNMESMFAGAGYSATTWSIGDLSSWDTSSVTNMSSMFCNAGSSATTFILDLSSWDTFNVTDMSYMFNWTGSSATTFTLDLSSWDTSSVTNMSRMFWHAGSSATTFTLNLSSWDTSSVTNMSSMFSNAGSSATTWSVTIPATNGNNISNTTSRLYGKTTSTYVAPPTGKSFTLAQP